jgi:hypothetical protein
MPRKRGPKHVELDSGWTVVTNSPLRPQLEGTNNSDGPRDPEPGLTSKDLHEQYAELQKKAIESNFLEPVQHIVAKQAAGKQYDKAICVALGSFSAFTTVTARKRSLQQLLAFVELTKQCELRTALTPHHYTSDSIN